MLWRVLYRLDGKIVWSEVQYLCSIVKRYETLDFPIVKSKWLIKPGTAG
jgi:hypothetical protein